MAVSMTQGFKRLRGALESELCLLAGYWAIGSTGAVGSQTAATGMTLTRTDVGKYTVQLTCNGQNARVPYILFPDVRVVHSDVDPSNDTDSFAARVSAFSASSGTVSIACYDEAGVVRELPSGATLHVQLTLKLSNVTR